MFENTETPAATLKMVLSEWISLPVSKAYPTLIAKVIKTGKVDEYIAESVLPQPHWKDYFSALLAGKDMSIENIKSALADWKDWDKLTSNLGDKKKAIEMLNRYFKINEAFSKIRLGKMLQKDVSALSVKEIYHQLLITYPPCAAAKDGIFFLHD